MRQVPSKKEFLLKLKLRKEDPVELPMDDQFFENMHNKIMQAVDATEIKPHSKWNKATIFLERKTLGSKALAKKIFKSGITGWVTSIGLGLIGMTSHAAAYIEYLKDSARL
jgi:hypothetical protein